MFGFAGAVPIFGASRSSSSYHSQHSHRQGDYSNSEGKAKIGRFLQKIRGKLFSRTSPQSTSTSKNHSPKASVRIEGPSTKTQPPPKPPESATDPKYYIQRHLLWAQRQEGRKLSDWHRDPVIGRYVVFEDTVHQPHRWEWHTDPNIAFGGQKNPKPPLADHIHWEALDLQTCQKMVHDGTIPWPVVSSDKTAKTCSSGGSGISPPPSYGNSRDAEKGLTNTERRTRVREPYDRTARRDIKEDQKRDVQQLKQAQAEEREVRRLYEKEYRRQQREHAGKISTKLLSL